MCPCKEIQLGARPHCINWWFSDLPRKSFRWYLDVYFENYAEMDSAHQELHFLLLWASQLSKRSSGGLGEVKKTVDGNTKIAFPEICPAAATVIDCWNCCWPSQEHKIWATSPPQPLTHPPLPPRLPIVWNFQSVNKGGEECCAIGSIILWTKLISGLESEDLQFYVLNYENVICSLTRISHSMT